MKTALETTHFDAGLIRKYNKQGPRYTSYPTAVQFSDSFNAAVYRQQVQFSNEELIPRPLSLYVHIPFCHELCYYCGCNKKVSQHPEQAVPYLRALYREIELQAALFDHDRDVVQLHFGGGTPTYLSDAQLAGLMAQLREYFNIPQSGRHEWSIEIDPRTMDENRIDLLAELGFNRISLGIQDFNPIVQRVVNRIQSPEQTEALIVRARQQGFRSISVDLIYGLPHQTVNSFKQTLDTVIAMRPDRLSIYSYAHLPELFRAQRLIKEESLPSAETKLKMFAATIQQLTTAGYRYIGMDHFALESDELCVAQDEGTLQRNFQGYSTMARCDLIGLGVSSIGQVGDCYSQNQKIIADYQAELENDQLPITRGLVMNDEDRLRRTIIQQIMCQDRVNFNAFSNKFHINFRQYFSVELELLEVQAADGLVVLTEDYLEVTPQGRLLLRSIAMIFDQYLKQTGNKARFSKMI
ncbi:MAG: oxygen-independent coproporphyrinogen III oxidase [Xanthomonadales bacterium]|nr:oxygen-independent coproporphyrinogen III oxidase [Xanthomonadales bacterium]